MNSDSTTEKFWVHKHSCVLLNHSSDLGGCWKVGFFPRFELTKINAFNLSTFQAGLVNGGPASLVYGFLLTFLGTLALSFSLAEMASM